MRDHGHHGQDRSRSPRVRRLAAAGALAATAALAGVAAGDAARDHRLDDAAPLRTAPADDGCGAGSALSAMAALGALLPGG